MATGTVTYNFLRAKTQRKALKPSNSIGAILLVQERILLDHSFPYALWAVLGLQSIAVECTAAIFFLTADWGHLTS